jgi:hypothetical protein
MHTEPQNRNPDTISLHDIFNKVRMLFRFLLRKWWVIILAGFIGGGLAIVYAVVKPITYSAKLTFLVEEGKSGMGGLASIAGQIGFDLAGLSSGGGLLSADNVVVFLKSKSLVRNVLMTSYDSSGTKSLADRYAEINNLKDKWKKTREINKEISFPVAATKPYSRMQDSLLLSIIDRILEKDLSIEKPDKKASFVQVSVEMRDELAAKYFCERLVKEATDRYVTTKTTRQAINVGRLQKRADSIGRLLNYKTYASAVSQETLLDINPGYKSTTVSAEVTGRDKMMLSTIYGEVIKNLEISKVALSQETPTIQVIDDVSVPLEINKIKKFPAFLVGILIASFFCSMILILKFLFKQNS